MLAYPAATFDKLTSGAAGNAHAIVFNARGETLLKKSNTKLLITVAVLIAAAWQIRICEHPYLDEAWAGESSAWIQLAQQSVPVEEQTGQQAQPVQRPGRRPSAMPQRSPTSQGETSMPQGQPMPPGAQQMPPQAGPQAGPGTAEHLHRQRLHPPRSKPLRFSNGLHRPSSAARSRSTSMMPIFIPSSRPFSGTCCTSITSSIPGSKGV